MHSANEATTSKWIIRTSTPKKSSVYDLDPGPSTSFNPMVNLQRLNLAGQSSSKPKRRGSIISMICEAIEAVGSPNKGASYIAIHKWITNNRKNAHTKNLRTFIRKEIAKGLQAGLLKRSSVSKKAVGIQGYFIVNEQYYSRNSRNSIKKQKFKVTENVNRAKPNQVKTVKPRPNSQESQIPQSLLDSIMKTKDTFEEAAQSILQQASKVLEVATKLIETSNSLVLNKVSEQNSDVLNPNARIQCVVPMQSRQEEETRIASMQFLQGGQVRVVAPMQSSQGGVAEVAPIQLGQGEARVASMNTPQIEKERIDPIPNPRGEEARVVPMQSPQNEYQASSIQSPPNGVNRIVIPKSRDHRVDDSQDELLRVASMQFPQGGQVRVTPIQLSQGGEAGLGPMQSSQGEAQRAEMNTYQVEKERITPIPYPQSGEARVAPQNEEYQLAPMSFPFGGEKQVVGTYSSKDEMLRAARLQSAQIGEARVTSVQQFQILEQSLQIGDSNVDQCSLPLQEVNNSPERELSEEELSVQRNLNFSSDSFGVEAEVSNLIQHLEANT